ncbi:hypothetical protein [Thermococcus barossii]|uniref:Dehydrogenase n=1 Tax=Thermococcus barossii TaxID=54077 RepID=A0A2Z2MJK4_9EURY|nr:hypothetical protein [Thermococcus barossii]ASJ04905.1 hypothetical protein A3L01_05820 [Thermococcus barossii]
MNVMRKYPVLFLFLLILILATSVVYEEYPKLSNNNEATSWEVSTKEETEQTPTAIKDNSTQTPLPGPLIELDEGFKGVNLSGKSRGFITCPQWLEVRWRRDISLNNTVLLNFTLFVNNTPYLNLILEEFSGSYFCIPEGVVVYSYYPGERRSSMALFDYNLTPLWRTEHGGSPVAYKNGSIILLGEDCLYLINVETGKLRKRICVHEYISHFKFVGDRLYITAAHLKGKAHLYVFEGSDRREVPIINIPTFELVGIRMPFDVNEKYIAVAYFLYPTDGAEKNGVCVFTADSLRKIACREFEEGERPLKVKLAGNVVYVQTTNGVKAYKILSLEQSSMQGTDDEV